VAKRHAQGGRTARENIADLCDTASDPGNFIEYGALAVAAQRSRRSLDDLIARTPADGLVCGVAQVGAEDVGEDRAATVVVAYDATVLAGTQGVRNHAKTDRMFQVAAQRGLPVVLLAEGGGGRPGDVDVPTGSWLDVPTFHAFARLSGTVPLVGVASGRCFAGNAALLGCCDVVIATEDATIGMGGPAMIEGGGLGVYAPEEVGPLDVQVPAGVVDVAVADEAEAIDVARRWLSYFQGPVAEWEAPDARLLRHAVPESRTRAYDVRRVLDGLADVGSVLEVRAEWGTSMVTALIRIEGRPYGVIANDPSRLGGAIDSDAADKAARFLGLCEAHRLPVVSLCDTPGFMVGPDSEATGAVRHVSRMFVVGAKLTVPLATIVLRKAYGLGAMAMAGGHLHVPLATVGWPTSELGPMGLEGAVRLGFRDELAAAPEGEERDALFARMVQAAYDVGRGLNAATAFELDDVIDPLDTRRWIVATLGDAPGPRTAAERLAAPTGRWVDPW
jgi:acetyl-CoA carboxylase carboxyltransferase component